MRTWHLRRGSAAVYLPLSHPEIEEFVELASNFFLVDSSIPQFTMETNNMTNKED